MQIVNIIICVIDNAEFRATEIEEEEKVLDLNQDLLAMGLCNMKLYLFCNY